MELIIAGLDGTLNDIAPLLIMGFGAYIVYTLYLKFKG